MFGGQKYWKAAYEALLALGDEGAITSQQWLEMHRVVLLNNLNYDYGKALA